MNDLLAIVADLYSPLQILLLCVALAYRPAWQADGMVWSRLAVSLVLSYGLMLADNDWRWWPHWGLDYSTHTALAFSLQLALSQLYPRWRGLSWLVYAGYLLLMKQLAYHSAMDMLSTMLVVALLLYLYDKCKFWLCLTK